MPSRRNLNLSKIIVWFVIVCGATIVVILCIFYFTSLQWEDNLNKQYAALTATDDNLVELGDDAHTVPITVEAAMVIGQSAMVKDLRVTVINAGEAINPKVFGYPYPGHIYWEVEFTIENMATTKKYPNPIVDSQMQYLLGEKYTREINWEGDCVPSIRNGVKPLDPSAKYVCRGLYVVPSDNQPLYWVYISIGYENYAVFRVR